MIKPFHELTKEEFAELVEAKLNYGQVERLFPQPTWCGYPNATEGLMGCWSLVAHLVTGPGYCTNCECAVHYIDPDDADGVLDVELPMTLVDLNLILTDIQCRDYRFKGGVMGDGYFIQVLYDEADVVTKEAEDQHGRKWYVSMRACKSEIVQTALKAVLTSMEHRTREHFKYKGVALFGPHLDVEELRQFVLTTAEDKRAARV
jgi:hypothetical protein